MGRGVSLSSLLMSTTEADEESGAPSDEAFFLLEEVVRGRFVSQRLQAKAASLACPGAPSGQLRTGPTSFLSDLSEERPVLKSWAA